MYIRYITDISKCKNRPFGVVTGKTKNSIIIIEVRRSAPLRARVSYSHVVVVRRGSLALLLSLSLSSSSATLAHAQCIPFSEYIDIYLYVLYIYSASAMATAASDMRASFKARLSGAAAARANRKERGHQGCVWSATFDGSRRARDIYIGIHIYICNNIYTRLCAVSKPQIHRISIRPFQNVRYISTFLQITIAV